MIEKSARSGPAVAALAVEEVSRQCWSFGDKVPALDIRPNPDPQMTFAHNYLVGVTGDKRTNPDKKKITSAESRTPRK